MNSTLESVVPLAMFFSSRTNPLITNWQIYLLPYDRTFEFPWERLLLGRQVESYLWVETLRPSSDFPPQIGAGAFGVVHVAVAVGIRESEDQVLRKPSWLPNSTDLFCSFWCQLCCMTKTKMRNKETRSWTICSPKPCLVGHLDLFRPWLQSSRWNQMRERKCWRQEISKPLCG